MKLKYCQSTLSISTEMKLFYLFVCIVHIAFVEVNAAATLKSVNFNIKGNTHSIPQKDGTFKLMTTAEIYRAIEIAPLLEPETDISFQLFTRLNPAAPQILQWANLDNIQFGTFNRNHPTRFTIHGWNSSPTSSINTRIREEYLDRGDFNVIAVDWEDIASGNYIVTRNNLPIIGDYIARVIDRLGALDLIDIDELSVIGHSLGAHISGLAGKNVTSGRIGTIIGMDPAGPLFSIENVNGRLDRSDASYVEIIHTNSGGSGFSNPIGHADFYPNGGTRQPGCGADASCSHSRSHGIFAESITTPIGFWSRQCADLEEIRNNICTDVGPMVPMGGEPSNRGRAEGLYYLETGEETPFALGI